MDNNTTQLLELLQAFCLERIVRTEDFAKAEADIIADLFSSLADAMGHALESFDDALFAEARMIWHVKDRRSRTLLTEFGDVSFARRVYIDECGDRRWLLDEVLGLRSRRRLSPGAFEALAYFGAEVPYWRAAKTAFRHCRTVVSSMTTMNTLREVGDLLEEQAAKRRHELFEDGFLPDAKGSADELCVEADGIWVALQGEGRPSVEVKAMCAYAGKKDGARIGCMHHAAVCLPRRFFEEGIAYLASHFSLDKIKCVYTASDGGGWDKRIAEYLPIADVTHKLDPWHLNRAIKVAWPDRTDHSPLFEMLSEGDVDALIAVLEMRYETGYGDKKKSGALIRYIKNNYDSICAQTPSMGTMESTNAHLYAARMKSLGCAWSIKGASDMARIRSHVFSGDDLPMPTRGQMFSEKDIRRRKSAWLSIQTKAITTAANMVESVGEGYEPPQGHLPLVDTNAYFRANAAPFH